MWQTILATWLAVTLLAACTVNAPDEGPATDNTAPEVIAHPDPQALLVDRDPALAANKRLAFDMWRAIVNAGHVELADDLLKEDYIQHSPILPTGRVAFKQIFSAVPRLDQIPDQVTPPLVAMLAEGDLVVMAMREELPNPNSEGIYTSTHFNLFRIEDGRLAEHWHSVQGVPGTELPFAGEGGPLPVTGLRRNDQAGLLVSETDALTANKQLVFDLWRAVVENGRNAAEPYLGLNYAEHNPCPTAGGGDFRAFSDPRADTRGRVIDAPLVALVAQGDLVVLVQALEHPDPRRKGASYTSTWFDMFRIADGKIAEHWDATIIPGTVVPFAN
jgi:predicted SnoaL-like aldol condensation-catalyzing enzyme